MKRGVGGYCWTLILVLALAPAAVAGAEGEDMREVIHTKSGEIIRGNLKQMRKGSIKIASDEVGTVSVGLGNIETANFPEAHTYRLSGRRTHVGPASISDGTLTIETAEGPVSLPASELMVITRGTNREIDFWSANAGLLVNGTSGNSDQLDLSAHIGIMRETTHTRWRTRYDGNYSTSRPQGTATTATTASNQRVGSTLDFFVTDRLFVTAPFFEYYRDFFQNISTRVSPGAGLGYEVLDLSQVFIDVNAGGAYQYTSFFSAPAGSSLTTHDFAVVLGTNINFDLPRGIEWDNLYRVNIVVTNIGQTSHHARSALSFDIWGPLDLVASFTFDRLESPQTTAAGFTPQSNDYRYGVGLALDF